MAGALNPVRRFEVYLVRLEPTLGSELRKTRPCVVISPDEMNRHLRTIIVAPMTTHGRVYPTRVPVTFDGTDGHVVLDQLRTIDTTRLVRRLGVVDELIGRRVLEVLGELFAP